MKMMRCHIMSSTVVQELLEASTWPGRDRRKERDTVRSLGNSTQMGRVAQSSRSSFWTVLIPLRRRTVCG